MSTIVYVEHSEKEGEVQVVIEENDRAIMTLTMTVVDLLQLAGRCMEVANEYFSLPEQPDEVTQTISPFGEQ